MDNAVRGHEVGKRGGRKGDGTRECDGSAGGWGQAGGAAAFAHQTTGPIMGNGADADEAPSHAGASIGNGRGEPMAVWHSTDPAKAGQRAHGAGGPRDQTRPAGIRRAERRARRQCHGGAARIIHLREASALDLVPSLVPTWCQTSSDSARDHPDGSRWRDAIIGETGGFLDLADLGNGLAQKTTKS